MVAQTIIIDGYKHADLICSLTHYTKLFNEIDSLKAQLTEQKKVVQELLNSYKNNQPYIIKTDKVEIAFNNVESKNADVFSKEKLNKFLSKFNMSDKDFMDEPKKTYKEPSLRSKFIKYEVKEG